MAQPSEQWSSSVEDNPFEARLWEPLSTSPAARAAMEEAYQDNIDRGRELVGRMREHLNSAREGVGQACDQFPSSREVELLRAVADDAWSSVQSTHQACAACYEREIDGIGAATKRWLRHGGRWAYEPGPLPSWQEHHDGYLAQPWTTRDAADGLAPRYRPGYFELARTIRTVARRAKPALEQSRARQLRAPARHGAYYQAHERAYESCVHTAMLASVHLNNLLEHALDGVAATAQRWWRDGIWEPPPRPRLIWGEFWA